MVNPWNIMTKEDYDKYKNNKLNAEKKNDYSGVYNSENEALRKKYNIFSDDYSYDDLLKHDAYGQNNDDYTAEKGLRDLNRYQNYSDPYAYEKSSLYNSLKDFSYNAKDDEVFNAYKKMYERQSQSEQDKVYSNLSALSGGRNSSFASAAISGVSQEYAKKVADIIPDLADKVYNRLLERYKLIDSQSKENFDNEKEKYDITYKNYNLAKDNAKDFRNDNQELIDENDKLLNSMISREKDNADIALKNKNMEKIEQEIQSGNIKLKYLDEKERLDLMLGNLDVKSAQALISQRAAAANKYNAEAVYQARRK